jgi:hypothetical protein
VRRLALSLGFVAASAAAALLAPGCSPREEAPGPVNADPKRGEALYGELCASCHGGRGEGGTGPSLRDWKRGEPVLADIIDARMPLGAPERCDRDCARAIAAYIVSAFNGPIVCDTTPPVPRGLRLLTRREYEATVADLLAGAATAAAPSGQRTFTYDPKGKTVTKVHVAGSFNGWPQTIAAGGWAMTKAGATFSVTRVLPVGKHQYKLVLDESEWLTDPTNPDRAADGFGGENSVADVSCSGPGGATAGGIDVGAFTRGFPADTRPEGFLFDDHGPSRVMGSVLADETMRAAAGLAKAVDPARLAGCALDTDACVDGFLAGFGKRAFRRPLTGAETARYRALVGKARDRKTGTALALRAMLTSPAFLYRTELGERQPDGTYRLTAWEAASALSYTLWGSMPDDALFDAALRGDLASPAGMEKQARRMLESPRARAQLATFAAQWLGAEGILAVDKNTTLFPEVNAELRQSMLEETRRLFTHVVLDGSHGLAELFTADYTFADERLAKLYGIGGVTGDMRKVAYPQGGLRAGILGHASVLSTTAHSDQTSPIRRGLFVRRRLLCQELPPPPPNAGGIPKVDPNATTRERFAQHTKNDFCASCHQYIDRVGFGFERFDPVGKLRDSENGRPIETTGDMTDVEQLGARTHAPFSSLKELGATLAASGAAKSCYVKQYWRFARGQKEGDVCATRRLERRFVERHEDMRELVVDLVADPDFTVRK